MQDRCYRAKRAIFRSDLFEFGYTQDLPVDGGNSVSDPILLPGRCGAFNVEHFMGDYHSVVAEDLHSFHTVVGAPFGEAFPMAILTEGWVSPGSWYW